MINYKEKIATVIKNSVLISIINICFILILIILSYIKSEVLPAGFILMSLWFNLILIEITHVYLANIVISKGITELVDLLSRKKES